MFLFGEKSGSVCMCMCEKERERETQVPGLEVQGCGTSIHWTLGRTSCKYHQSRGIMQKGAMTSERGVVATEIDQVCTSERTHTHGNYLCPISEHTHSAHSPPTRHHGSTTHRQWRVRTQPVNSRGTNHSTSTEHSFHCCKGNFSKITEQNI